MSRETTSGYDATASVDGIVVRHAVEAMFEAAEIPDSFSAVLRDGRRLDVLLSAVSGHLAPPPGGSGFRVMLTARIARVLIDGADAVDPALLALAEVRLPVSFVRRGDLLMPDFAALTDDDIDFPDISGDASLAGDIRGQIRAALLALPAARLSLRLSLADPSLGLDGADLVTLSGEGDHGPALVAGIYSTAVRDAGGANPSRGSAVGLVSQVHAPDTLAVRLSAEVFDRLIEAQLRARYGQGDLVVPRADAAPDRAGPFLVSAVDTSVDTAGLSEGVATVSSGPGLHASCWIEIQTPTITVSTLSADDGSFTIPIPATTGETVSIRGRRIRTVTSGGSVELPRPEIRLRDGYIEVSGRAMVEDAIDFDADYRAELVLEPDPTHPTALRAGVRNSSADIPWYLDLLLFLLGIFGGIIKALIDESVGNRVLGLVAGQLPAPPTEGSPGRVATFVDAVAIASTHIEFSGSLNYGNIEDSGIVEHNTSWDGFLLQPLVRLTGSGGVAIPTPLVGPSLHLLTGSFARVGERMLKLTYTDEIPSAAGVTAGSMFALENIDGDHSKVRVDAVAPTPIARFVRYGAPLTPYVELVGDLELAAPGYLPSFAKSGPSPVWSIQLQAVPDLRRFHLPGATFAWEVVGEGRWSVDTGDLDGDTLDWELTAAELGLRAASGYLGIGVADLPDGKRIVRERSSVSSQYVSITFTVTGTDVFGRVATASRFVDGVIGYPTTSRGDIRAGRVDREALPDPGGPRIRRQWQ